MFLILNSFLSSNLIELEEGTVVKDQIGKTFLGFKAKSFIRKINGEFYVQDLSSGAENRYDPNPLKRQYRKATPEELKFIKAKYK